MTPVQRIIELLAERRAYPRNSLDWQYRTAAARTLLRIARGAPACDWPKAEYAAHE